MLAVLPDTHYHGRGSSFACETARSFMNGCIAARYMTEILDWFVEVVVPNTAIVNVASSQCPVEIFSLGTFDVDNKEDPSILS